MKLNRTLAYGLACLHHLGEHDHGEWTEIKDISRFQGLPPAYCNKVMQALVHVGFVQSQKGRGYRLIKDLDDISVWQLMEAFTFNGAPDSERKELSMKLYCTLKEQVNKWLVGLTVKDIIEMMLEQERREKEGKDRTV
ncbi:MAG: hypothetical protein Fur0012_03110 [Elusimicrobiota bacterium]